MHRMRRLTMLAVAALALSAFTAPLADDTLKDWAEDRKLPDKMVILGHTTGAVKELNEAGIAKPKRVGLISFYMWDEGSREFNAMARAYGGTYERTAGLTPKGANHFATKFSEQGIPALKQSFAAHGMELVLPEEFITTDAQKQAYVGFELPFGRIASATMAAAEWMKRTPNASSAAAGFNGIHSHLWTDAKVLTALDSLRQVLGLEAMAVVWNNTNSNATAVSVWQIGLHVYGPNPIPKPANRLAQISWAPGALWGNGYFGKGFKGAQVATLRRGELQSEDYEGYGRIVQVLADEVLKVFDEQYGK